MRFNLLVNKFEKIVLVNSTTIFFHNSKALESWSCIFQYDLSRLSFTFKVIKTGQEATLNEVTIKHVSVNTALFTKLDNSKNQSSKT